MRRDLFRFLLADLLFSLSGCFNPPESSDDDGIVDPGTTGESPPSEPEPAETSGARPSSPEGSTDTGTSTSDQPAPTDATTGDASTDDASTDDASTGDASTGDASTGGLVPGDASGSGESTGDPETPPDPLATALVSGLDVAIPDGTYDGSLGSMACVSLDIEDPRIVADVGVMIGMTHTFIGDLVIKIVPPAGEPATILSRPGLVEPFDGIIPPTGNGSPVDLDRLSPVSFFVIGADSAEDMGSGLPSDGVACRDDGVCLYRADAGANAAFGDLTTLTGMVGTGTWQVCFGDATNSDAGTVDQILLMLHMQ